MQNDDDKKFFKEAMSNVEPLKKSENKKIEKIIDKTHFQKTPAIKFVPKTLPFDEPQATYKFYDNEYFPISAEQEITFSRAGFSSQNQKELRAGKWPTQATLDLHGNTVDEAREKVAQFLTQAIQKNQRCIKIIHGKGRGEQPILKNKVAQWLPQCQDVLAFCSAAPNDGGSGVVLVLLKKKVNFLYSLTEY